MQLKQSLSSGQLICKIIGNRIAIPPEFFGKTVSAQIYTTTGKLIRQEWINTAITKQLKEKGLASEGSYIVKLRLVQ
jgi:hypothetical protein